METTPEKIDGAAPVVAVRPHPLSNDMTDEPLRRPDAAERREERSSLVPRKERRLAGRLGLFVGGVLVIAVVLAGLFLPGYVFFAGVVMALAYGLLLLMPVILADSTKVAQDEDVRAGKQNPGTHTGA